MSDLAVSFGSKCADGLRPANLLPIVAMLAGIAATGPLDGSPSWLLMLPLVASALVFGLPHGAADHVVLFDLTGRWIKPISTYCALALSFVLVWWVAPAMAFWAFIAMTVVHWGTGDAFHLLRDSKAPLPADSALAVTTSLLRGAIPMLVPLVAFPDRFAAFGAATASLFDQDASLISNSTPSVALYGLVVLGVLHFGRVLQLGAYGPWAIRDAGEVFLLVAAFALLDPLVSIGLYFCFWHSVRHLDRLGEWYSVSKRLRGRSLWKDVLPTTGIALGSIALLALMVPNTPNSGLDAVAIYVVVISALTVPHMITVFLMDQRQCVFPWTGLQAKATS
jgi:Brp/Blh family beta-carotene 15,15'-monooxygenase